MVLPARPQPDAGSVIEPEPRSLGLFLWRLQPLAPPDAFDTPVVHLPAFRSQQRRDPTIVIVPVLASQADDGGRQDLLIKTRDGGIALGRARLPQNPASPTLGNPVRALNVLDTSLATFGAYQFPSAASFKISLFRGQIGHGAFETAALGLQFLQPTALIDLELAVLPAPAIVTLLRYPNPMPEFPRPSCPGQRAPLPREDG